MTKKCVLIRYGEIGLKTGGVRGRFEKKLISNIKFFLDRKGIDYNIETRNARIYVYSDSLGKVKEELENVFGIVSFSETFVLTSDYDEITKFVGEIGGDYLKENESFAIRARRSGEHDYTSQELARDAGAAVVEKTNCDVDLTKPDKEIHIEVKDDESYVFTSIIDGLGGLPYDVEGKVLAVISNIEDAASAWLIARRGCGVVGIHNDIDEKLKERLEYFFPRYTFYDKGKKVDEIIKKHKIRALISEDKLGTDLPVLRPLIGLKKEEKNFVLEKIKA